MTHHWQKQLCCHHRPSPGSSWWQPKDCTVLARYLLGSEYFKFCEHYWFLACNDPIKTLVWRTKSMWCKWEYVVCWNNLKSLRGCETYVSNLINFRKTIMKSLIYCSISKKQPFINDCVSEKSTHISSRTQNKLRTFWSQQGEVPESCLLTVNLEFLIDN